MNVLRTDEPPRPGLRERKKAKTRAAIQEHALRLFRERGYDETTIEQIAEAAEVSPSTFFRYFSTKEAVALYDPLDPLIIAAFRSQPRDLSPVQALRRTIHEVFGAMSASEVEAMWERAELMQAPQMRAAVIEEFLRSLRLMAEVLGERVGLPADDFAVQTAIGAVAGVMLVGWLGGWLGDSRLPADVVARMDRALELLEAGLPLQAAGS